MTAPLTFDALALALANALTKLDTALTKIDRLESKLDQMAEASRPRLLNRVQVAAMLGMSPASLGMHLRAGAGKAKGRSSKLGETLLSLAIVGLDGKQAWRPSDIAAHCRPWLGERDDNNTPLALVRS